jgi:urea transporter/tetratricopeptide (TPR) repeat protein
MIERVRVFFRGCAEVIFLQSSACGLILLALLLVRPSMALTGGIAVLAAYGVARLIGMQAEFHESSFYAYNPLLVGLSLGYRSGFPPTLSLSLLAVLAGLFTLFFTAFLARLMRSAKLPILSLPFALIGPLFCLAMMKHVELLGTAAQESTLLDFDCGLPLRLAGLFKAFGAIFFLPSVLVGMVIAAMILRRSRILFLLAVLGYYAGTFVRDLMFPAFDHSFLDGNSFNFILVAMAVGAVFVVPSLQSSLLGLLAAAVAPMLVEALTALGLPYGIPPFTLPFCLITLGTLYVLRAVNYPFLATEIGASPEEMRENSLVNRFRYRGEHRTLYLPFSGTWTVTQGFNGRWTHQGKWRYAYDFVVSDEGGKNYRADGALVQDYFCYRMSVLAPVRGHVVKVIDHLPDNSIGNVDGGNNWGNMVVLYDPRGFYVEISHFAPRSIRVKVGGWVERGAVLGLCGNSGYSPQPHIHVQVQTDDGLGAATLPFSFVSYRAADCYHANDLPAEGDRVEPLYPETRLDEVTNFLLDDVQEYEIFHQEVCMGRFKLRVGMAPDGSHYFESERARLYFGKHEGTFYVYRLVGDDPYLRLLFLALPRLPLAYTRNLTWCDYIPIGVAATGMKRGLARLATFLWPSAARIKVTQTFRAGNCIESLLESKVLRLNTAARVRLDEQHGFASVQVGGVELRNINDRSDVTPSPGTRQPSRERKNIMKTVVTCFAMMSVVLGAKQAASDEAAVHQALVQSCEQEKNKDYPKAIAVLLAQDAANKGSYVLNLRLGWLHYLNHKNAEAERYYRAAIESNPNSIEAKLGCLLPLLGASKLKEAETLARQIIKEDPRNYYANLRLATALRLQKKSNEALQIVKWMLVTYPSDVSFAAELAQLNAPPDAKDAANQSAESKKQIDEAVRNSVQQEGNRNYAEAIQAILGQYAAHPQDYRLNLRMGWLYYLSGSYDNSAQHYYAALQLVPQSFEAGVGYLLPLLAQARYPDAESFARDIVKSDAKNYYANLRLAVALRLQGKYADAEQVVKPMLDAYPADIYFLGEMAMLNLAQNKKDAARQLFSNVLSLDPENATAKHQLRQL